MAAIPITRPAAITVTETAFTRVGNAMGNFLGFLLLMGIVAGWLNHLYVCFTEQMWGFLIAGAIFFPVGVVHGWGLWLGFW